MRRTGGSLCPVSTWIAIITRILSYPRGTTDSPINIVRTGRSYSKITSTQVRETLRKTVTLLREDEIGVKIDQVGTHSIRSTFAMILFTHGIEKTTIMRLGRWKSDAVLCYIRSQVSGFGKQASHAFQKDPGKDFANFPLSVSPSNIVNERTTPIDNITSQPNLPQKNPTTENSPKRHNTKHRYYLRSRLRNR